MHPEVAGGAGAHKEAHRGVLDSIFRGRSFWEARSSCDISHRHSSWTPGVFYTYFYDHVNRLRLEKLLYLELSSTTESEQNPAVRILIKFKRQPSSLGASTQLSTFSPWSASPATTSLFSSSLDAPARTSFPSVALDSSFTPSPWPSLLLSAQATKKLLCTASRENKSGCQEHRSDISPTMKKPW